MWVRANKMHRVLKLVVYVLTIAAGASLFWSFFENTARPHVIVATAGGFLVVAGAYMLWTELVSEKA
jgi:hypothetical protein